MSQFISDLALGVMYEDEYIKMRNFTKVHHPIDKAFTDYDFKNLETQLTYEVKADRMTCKTGNIFVEFECSGKPSGIMATKADFWIHFICKYNNLKCDEYVKIKVDNLKELIKNNNLKVKNGGDNYNAKGYIIPRRVLKTYLRDCDVDLTQKNAHKK
jgi:hypothetical protein